MVSKTLLCELTLVALGIDDGDAQRQNLDVYVTSFQRYFIQATERYYRDESTAFVATHSVPDYMKKAETRLQQENDRISLYLHDTTRRDVSILH